jgi:hypothetical protein
MRMLPAVRMEAITPWTLGANNRTR